VYVPNSANNEKYIYLIIIMMIVSSGLSIIIVKIFKCLKSKKGEKDITPIADLEMHKNKSLKTDG